MTETLIKLDNVSKVYQDKTVVSNLSLDVHAGEFLVLVGSSGSGKTTTLKMVNQLITQTEGAVIFKGKNVSEYNLRDLRLQIGYVLQQIALFPNMTVGQNISLIPEMKKQPKAATSKMVDDLLREVDMDPANYRHRMPNELSGGEQQRIGILRAFAANQDVVLMDEPFSALDPILRSQLQALVKKIHQQFGTTIIFVTHDMDEALRLGDRIAVMRHGQILQVDTPEEIVKNPANSFVSELFANSMAQDVFGVYLSRLELLDYLEVQPDANATVDLETSATVGEAIKLLAQRDTITLATKKNGLAVLTKAQLFKFISEFQDM
ncbi:ABC transporter ATP-binding protein [Periweissella ghanensis]|uniref:Vitamin B12 import ATP-binding protein BtuD n=1 Tax=Periweissella ghanensis TaxID=467997 RepID=A0ABM8ZBA0_9LACO|nr:ABC transporter ATP-binding protein [Periweissella ghanensis]MCM0600780.1 ABC transporter ATP-binding protein [Periweissella ghanensis]CAH0418578.1 Vitamin B12 import ATP-binding protein BtuD [Periweissella ghanensis]